MLTFEKVLEVFADYLMTARDDSVLADKISRLIIWYSLQKRDLSDEEKKPPGFLPGGVLPAVRDHLR